LVAKATPTPYDVPFYVALPSPTIDWEIERGAEIPIEPRDSRGVTHIEGWTDDGRRLAVRVTPEASPAAKCGFDVTPARLVTALVTERGVRPTSRSAPRIAPGKRVPTDAAPLPPAAVSRRLNFLRGPEEPRACAARAKAPWPRTGP
jgi:hypothetical protein